MGQKGNTTDRDREICSLATVFSAFQTQENRQLAQQICPADILYVRRPYLRRPRSNGNLTRWGEFAECVPFPPSLGRFLLTAILALSIYGTLLCSFLSSERAALRKKCAQQCYVESLLPWEGLKNLMGQGRGRPLS